MQPFCQNSQLSRSLESELENAVKTGELKLSAKNLRDFPKHGDRYNLQDTILTDLSRNKLLEVPGECTRYRSMERLLLYHNTIKSIPDNIVSLASLMYLDLSRNQLSYLPASVCSLVNLQCLVANNNRLVSLPEEIGEMTSLMELDVSCNEIAHLPVQIGDLASLRSLHLRRNHLQEVPVELTYLQLTFLDLAGNRLASLPVELRFMVTLCDLQLEENPLTCPPANLCGRGRVHIFKYLEIQAIKEDKKRGVLTEGEYRRSYRKTSQLNDMRFGLSADARRKRNTADSGYGSEQPLDRRWSQEFAQETEGVSSSGQPGQTEDARRLAHRAISYRPAMTMREPVIKPAMMMPPHAPVTRTHMMTSNNVHHGAVDRADSGIGGGSGSGSSPTTSLDMVTREVGGLNIQEPVKLAPAAGHLQQQQQQHQHHDAVDGRADHPPPEHKPHARLAAAPLMSSAAPLKFSGPQSLPPEAEVEAETEERRRTAQRVFSKQSSQSRSVGRLPLPTSSPALVPQQQQQQQHQQQQHQQQTGLKSPSSPHHSGLPPPPANKETKSISSIQTYRQFKEQQRLARQDGPGYHQPGHKTSDPGPRGSHSGHYTKTQRQSTSDIKSAQKEAVMSYMDRMGSSSGPRAGSAGAPPDIAPPPPPGYDQGELEGGRNRQGELEGGRSRFSASPRHSAAPSGQKASTSIPTARSIATASSRPNRMAPSQPPSGQAMYQGAPSVTFTAKREAERTAVQDTHIHHLRHQIESRLKVSLGEDLSSALADGVVLCHIANHVSPRAVSSIHVPSPAVPKLTGAKCRRNVDNFLAACRRIGVREDLICSVTDIMEPKRTNTVRVAITVTELVRFYTPRNNQTMNI